MKTIKILKEYSQPETVGDCDILECANCLYNEENISCPFQMSVR